jgi:subtilisin family serine protease
VILQMRRAGDLALAGIKADASETGCSVLAEFWLTHSVTVECNRAQLLKLTSRKDVGTVNHTKQQIILCLDVSRPLIQADQVESSGFDGSGVDVAVIDTGVDFTHFALTAVAGVQLDFTGEGLGDLHGHGSHCAGIVASQNDKFRGVAPGCTVHDYKILDMNGSGNATNCIAAIQQAVTDGRDVLSNSYGFTHANGAWVCPDGTCVVCQAANAAVAAGVVFVVAAGNDDNDTCSTYDTHINCPGHATDAITVAASNDSDNMARDSYGRLFSSIGPAADGRAKPDITAPGEDIISVRATTGNDMAGIATIIDKDWAQVSGTSQATPHVAGVCALMLEKNARLTPANIKSTLAVTAVNIGVSADEMGAGRVDALAAVNAV